MFRRGVDVEKEKGIARFSAAPGLPFGHPAQGQGNVCFESLAGSDFTRLRNAFSAASGAEREFGSQVLGLM